MTAQDLKNSILQLAVEGKLLSRKEVAEALETTEGPKTGAELLEQIKAEKARLIAEGKIKKDTTKAGASGRALAEITEDEKPFDIPENWCWCKLNDISNITKLAGFEYSDYIASNLVPAGIPLFKGQNVRESTISYNFESFIPETLSDQLERSQITKKCLLTPYVGAGVGNVGIHTKKGKFHLGSNVGKIEIVLNDIGIEEYVHVFLKSITGFQEMTKHIKATGIPSISIEALRDVNIPLPPLAEQKVIVAKIEELLPYIQKYDVAHTKLEEFNKKFPVEMQKSILQQAIMGKLTEDWRNEQASLAKTNSAVQLADRTSAKDLLKKIKAQKARLIAEGKIKKDTTKAGASGRALAEITEEEIPFDIPESWCWCRLGDICFDIKRGKSPKYVEKSNYLAFAQKCNVKTGGINLEIALYLDESTISRYSNTDCLVQGDVVINSTGGGTMGRVGYFECEIPKGIKGIYPDSHVTTIRTVGFMEQKFVFYFLKTKQKELESLGEGSTNQTELKPYTLQNLLLPLPPLAEQKVIVAKIEELLPLCKKLVK
ncbi:restriction endonuclease subunit S [uncultured Treponema sp.]|uniref:restriction endonuclease subunit S n=1 Tax=uncultured Treponema sp. TaxID=162155 RepID=UPI00259ADBBA|nr:restriction endonuclease subunit S [uncultured Treponema sp.]